MRRAVLVLLALALAGCGPTGPLPGGSLHGTLAPPPADWSSVVDETVQLETNPEDPYSVNLWGVGMDGAYYVGASRGGEARWVKHIQHDPHVRLQAGDRVYELRAARVTDDAELERFGRALAEKYDFEVTPEQRDRAWVFRLAPR